MNKQDARIMMVAHYKELSDSDWAELISLINEGRLKEWKIEFRRRLKRNAR